MKNLEPFRIATVTQPSAVSVYCNVIYLFFYHMKTYGFEMHRYCTHVRLDIMVSESSGCGIQRVLMGGNPRTGNLSSSIRNCFGDRFRFGRSELRV